MVIIGVVKIYRLKFLLITCNCLCGDYSLFKIIYFIIDNERQGHDTFRPFISLAMLAPATPNGNKILCWYQPSNPPRANGVF